MAAVELKDARAPHNIFQHRARGLHSEQKMRELGLEKHVHTLAKTYLKKGAHPRKAPTSAPVKSSKQE